MRKFGRVVKLRVGPPGFEPLVFPSVQDSLTQPRGFRIQAAIEMDDTPSPDVAKIQISGIADATIGFFLEPDAQVAIEAGYGNQTEMVFSGDIDEEGVLELRDGQDRIIEFTAGDGRNAYRNSRITRTFRGQVNSRFLIQQLAQQMGLGQTIQSSSLSVLNYSNGWSFQGPVRSALDEIARDIDARWMIQDGALVITEVDQPIRESEQPVQVNADTGMVGIPERTDIGLRFTTLMEPRIRPRRLCRVRSDQQKIDGTFLVKKVNIELDGGWDQPFYTTVEQAVEYRAGR